MSNEIRKSADGKIWILVRASLLDNIKSAEQAGVLWSARKWAQAVVEDDLMYLVGGGQLGNDRLISDVWSTEDGTIWTQLNPNIYGAGNSPKIRGALAVFENILVYVGGSVDNNSLFYPYIQYSKDGGSTWIQHSEAVNGGF